MASQDDQFPTQDETPSAGDPQPVDALAGAESVDQGPVPLTDEVRTDSDAAVADTAPEGADAASEGEAPKRPARKRAARKTTKKAAPTAPDPLETATGEGMAGDEGPVAPSATDTSETPARPARKRAARKSTKKAAAAESAAGPGAPTTATASGDEQPGTDAADAPQTAGSPGAAEAQDAAESVMAAGITVDEDDPEISLHVVDVDFGNPLPDYSGLRSARAEDEAATSEEAEEDAGSGQSPFGLMFQAPEPTTPRRSRRASAPQTDPTGAGERAEREDDRAPEPTDTADDRSDDERDDDQSTEEGRGRSRRRRGGKGRRGKAGDDQPDSGDDSTDRDDADDTEDQEQSSGRSRRRRGSRRSSDGDQSSDQDKGDQAKGDQGKGDQGTGEDDDSSDGESRSSRRRRRRRRGGAGDQDDPPGTVTKVRESRRDEPTAVKGSTRLEAKKQRRREGREAGRRRTIITEAEFLARRESVERTMVVREQEGRTQIGVLEDGILVEHYVSRESTNTMAGNVYLGRVQNVLPSMEAAFIDIGKGRNAVLYAGEVNWDAAGLDTGGGQAKRIENALKSGDTVLVQVTKDPIGHKGARLTSQVSLPGRYLVYVPEGSMTGISRKLPDTERSRLKGILKQVVPDSAGVIVRTAAEGASEEELRNDVERLSRIWQKIQDKAESKKSRKASAGGAPVLLHGESDMTVRVIRDVFNEDFSKLVVSGDRAWSEISEYIEDVAPDLRPRLERWTGEGDVFAEHRIDEGLAKAMDRKVWLPSGGSLVIDRTEAMTVVDVNTGKFVGSGGNLEETVTKNNIEAAEEIVRQLRLRDIGGIIVVDFIDMVLESNRDLVVRRLLECLGRDRTKHQVAEVTSLGLVQMTRKRVGAGLIEVFSEPCEHCGGRGLLVHSEPVERNGGGQGPGGGNGPGSRRGRRGKNDGGKNEGTKNDAGKGKGGENRQPEPALPERTGPTAAQIAAAAHAAALKSASGESVEDDVAELALSQDLPRELVAEGQPVTAAEADTEQAAEAGESAAGSESTDGPAGSTPSARLADTEDPEPAPAEPAPAAAAPRRRKRGRVVAPAGPPKPTDS